MHVAAAVLAGSGAAVRIAAKQCKVTEFQTLPGEGASAKVDGKLVEIDHGYGVKSRYAHNSQMFVKAGQVVQKGQVISTVGTTGQSTGPHLHFEVVVDDQKVNPMAYLPRRKPSEQANSRSVP